MVAWLIMLHMFSWSGMLILPRAAVDCIGSALVVSHPRVMQSHMGSEQTVAQVMPGQPVVSTLDYLACAASVSCPCVLCNTVPY